MEDEMTHQILAPLVSDDFFLGCFLGTVQAAESFLRRDERVAAAKTAFVKGEISRDDLEELVRSFSTKLERGKSTPYDLTLAAIALILEGVARTNERAMKDLADLWWMCARDSVLLRVSRHVVDGVLQRTRA